MSDNSSFDDVMARLKAGDPQAEQEVWDRFVKRLKGLARKKLDGQLPGKLSDSTLAVSALKSFFCRQADGQFILEDWDDVWSLLATITVNKYCNAVTHWGRQMRDVRREVSIPTESGDSDDTSVPWLEIAAASADDRAEAASPERQAIRREQDEIFQKLLQEFRGTLGLRD